MIKLLKAVFKEASIGISRGSTLQENFEKHPEVFDEMYLALVSAGETAGLLPEVLDREAKLLESLSKIKGQIQSALTYPIAIFVLNNNSNYHNACFCYTYIYRYVFIFWC